MGEVEKPANYENVNIKRKLKNIEKVLWNKLANC